MAASGRIAGKDLYIEFGGVDLSADFTAVSVSDEGELVDVTAGADTYHYFISLARRNGNADYEGFYDGSTTTAWDAIAPNTEGTLIIAPKGTESGNPKWEWSRALIESRSADIPFDEGVTVSATIQFSSQVAETAYS